LLARVVQAERLTGHTQFWITRPYRWPLLLAAKLLFAAVFIYLPFLVVQCILLRAAGFHPLSYIPGILFNLLLLTITAVLPLMALAALTGSIARMTLAILGVLAYIAAIATLSGLLPRLGSSPDLVGGDTALALLAFGTAAVILVLYSRRRTRTAWLLLAAATLLIGTDAVFDPDQPFMNRWYPPATANATPPAQFTLSTNPMTPPIAHGTAHSGIIEIAIPIHVNGVASNSVLIPAAVKFTLQNAGSHWESPWKTVTTEKFLPGPYDTVFRIRMPRETYEQFRTGPIALHMTFAVDQARAIRHTTIPSADSPFEVPGFAMCRPVTGWDGEPEPVTIGINCLSAMRLPDLTFIAVTWHDTCPAQNSGPLQAISGYGWAGSPDPGPAEFGLTSVWEVPMSLTNNWRYSNRTDEERIHMRQLCPGAPLTFTTYALDQRTRVDLSIPSFRLPELSQATTAEYKTQ
jgi:hypothetical protein